MLQNLFSGEKNFQVCFCGETYLVGEFVVKTILKLIFLYRMSQN